MVVIGFGEYLDLDWDERQGAMIVLTHINTIADWRVVD